MLKGELLRTPPLLKTYHWARAVVQKYLPPFLYFSLKELSVAFFQRTKPRFSWTRENGERRQKCIKQFQTKPSSSTPIAFWFCERITEQRQQPQNQPNKQLTIFASSGPDITKLVHITVHGKKHEKTHVDGLEIQSNQGSLQRLLSAKSLRFLVIAFCELYGVRYGSVMSGRWYWQNELSYKKKYIYLNSGPQDGRIFEHTHRQMIDLVVGRLQSFWGVLRGKPGRKLERIKKTKCFLSQIGWGGKFHVREGIKMLDEYNVMGTMTIKNGVWWELKMGWDFWFIAELDE